MYFEITISNYLTGLFYKIGLKKFELFNDSLFRIYIESFYVSPVSSSFTIARGYISFFGWYMFPIVWRGKDRYGDSSLTLFHKDIYGDTK